MGPAGVAMAVAAISALRGRPVDGAAAVTGEISVRGEVRPVGGVPSKIEAARRAGLARVFVPAENYLERFSRLGIDVRPVRTLAEVLEGMLLDAPAALETAPGAQETAPLAAQGAITGAQ